MSAQPCRQPVADRMIAGSTAAAQWTQIHAVAPQIVATMQRYLQRLAAFQAPTSVDVAENSLRHFARWLLGETALDAVAAVRRDDIEDFKVWLAARPHPRGGTISARDAPAAVAHGALVLRADHRMGLGRRAGPQPGHRTGTSRRSPSRCRTSSTTRDAARFMAAARASTDPRDRLVVELLARTGMRGGELVDLEADAVVQIGGNHWLRIPLGKLRNDRYVPLHPQLVDLLAEWTATNLEHIRAHRAAGRRSPRPAEPAHRSAASSTASAAPPACDGVHPHRLRHTLATQAINRGMRLEAIAALLGPQEDGNDPDLRAHREPGRRRRIRRGQRQDRRPLRPATRTARRLRDHRHGPATPRSHTPACSATASAPARSNSTAAWNRPAKPAPTSAPASQFLPILTQQRDHARRTRTDRTSSAVRRPHPTRRRPTRMTTMPDVNLDLSDAIELAELLTFLADWLSGSQRQTLADNSTIST